MWPGQARPAAKGCRGVGGVGGVGVRVGGGVVGRGGRPLQRRGLLRGFLRGHLRGRGLRSDDTQTPALLQLEG